MKFIIGIFLGYILYSLALFFPRISYAQIVLNEFGSGSTSDWVEVYNTGTASADLAVYRLRDSGSSNKKDLIGSIDAGQFTSFSFSNYLNGDGDSVRLYKIENGGETLIEEIKYGDAGGVCEVSGSQSIGKSPDGGSNIVRFASNTRDASNNSASTSPCSSPSPTPKSSPSPTPTPTPIASKSPTLTPTIRPNPLSTSKISPSPSSKSKITSPSPTTEDVLGNSSESAQASASATASPSAEPANSGSTKAKVLGVLLIIGGVVFSGIGGWLAYKKMQKDDTGSQ